MNPVASDTTSSTPAASSAETQTFVPESRSPAGSTDHSSGYLEHSPSPCDPVRTSVRRDGFHSPLSLWTEYERQSFIQRFFLRNPGYSAGHIIWYDFCKLLLHFGLTLFYDFRADGLHENTPPTGGLIVICNHQTNLDPPIVGVGSRRDWHFMAKLPLFTNPVFGKLIQSVNAISLNQEKSDMAAIKAALGHLQKGRVVFIFPEGSRTFDGALNEFKPGVALLIKRGRVPVMPMAMEGAFDVWHRHQKFPHVPGHIAVRAGPVIPYEVLHDAGSRGSLKLLMDRVDDVRMELRAELRYRTKGRFPRPGHGDFRHDDPRLAELRAALPPLE